MAQVISLAGQKYIVKGAVRQFYVQRQTEPFRLQGIQSRDDDASVGRYVNTSFPLGLGWGRLNRKSGRGVGGLLDATTDTAHIPATLGRLQETQTHAAPADHFRKAVNFKGDLWAAWEQDYSATLLNCVCVTKFGGSTDTWVAVDAPMYNDSTAGSAAAGVSSLTVSHTVQATLGNRIVVAIVSSEAAAGSAPPTGVTYAGAAMTQLDSQLHGGGNSGLSIWYKVAPSTGANDCVATFGGNMNGIIMHVADYYFVNQSTPFGTAAKATGTATSASVNVTGTAGDLIVGGVMHTANEATAVGTSQVEREDTAIATLSAECSEERATGATTAWSASWTSNVTYATIAAPLLAAGFVAAPESPGVEGMRVWDMVAHKGSLFLLCIGHPTSELIYKVLSSTDGDAWIDASGAVWPDDAGTNRYLPATSVTRRNDFNDDMGKLLPFGNTLLAAIFRHPSSNDGLTLSDVQVLSTADSGSTWASDVTIPSGDGPKTFVSWKNLSAASAPVLVLAEGVYSIDITNNLFDLIYALDGDPNNGRWCEVDHNGYLHISLGSGGQIALNIPTAGTLEVITVGPPGDGLVSARQGHVNYMLKTPSEWLMVAYGGHAANKNASIFMIDTSVLLTDPETGKRFMPWHHFWQDSTGNLDIVAMAYSTEDDATPRLHFAVEGAAASINYHIENPLSHPLQATIKYQASSVLRLPVDDLGDPHQSAMLLLALLYADDLSAATTGEYIQHHYGVNGAADTTVDNGDFLSGDLDLPFFATGSITAFADAGTGLVTVTSAAHGLVEGDRVTISGTTSYNGSFTIRNVATNTFAIFDTWVADDATGTWVSYKGVSAKTIGQRLTFNRDAGDNTQTPKLYDFEVQGQNVYLKKRAWELIIDVEEMVKDSSSVKPNLTADTNIAQTIRANIEAIATSGTLVPFSFNDADGVLYVRTPNDRGPQFELTVMDSDNQRRGYALGNIQITLEEGS